MRKLAILCVISALLFSCKKDKLEGDKSIFIGKWEWIYSKHISNICSGDPPTEEMITPSSDGNNYAMEFLKKGVVNYYQNEEKIGRDRLVFDYFEDVPFPNTFYIYLNNKVNDESSLFFGFIVSDTITLNKGFPYQSINSDCEKYISYFVKQ